MTTPQPELDIEVVPQLDTRLGRQKVHDPRSKNFPLELAASPNQEAWTNKFLRIIDPPRNPNQCHGECTGCSNAMMMNSEGNRREGVVLDMNYAHRIYSAATKIDPYPGTWPPTDTGSSGLAAAKAAQRLGEGKEYRHIFNGADGIVEAIQKGRAVSVGTWWYEGQFNPNHEFVIEPTGARAGGHQYTAHGYWKARDLIRIRCWWGNYRDVWIARHHLNDLVMDGGDAYVQDRVIL